MLRRAAAGTFAVVAFAALACAGDEAKRYDVEWRERWKSGDVVTVTLEESGDFDAPQMPPGRDATSAEYVLRCDEADANGRAVRRTVFFKSWKRTRKAMREEADDSLKSAVVRSDGTNWTRADGKALTGLARDWLSIRFDKRVVEVDPALQVLSPPASMAVGEEWKPDAKAAVGPMTEPFEGAKLVADGASLSVKLVSVDGAPPAALGRFEMKLQFPLGSNPGTNYAPGSVTDLTRTVVRPLAGGAVGSDHVEFSALVKQVMNRGPDAGKTADMKIRIVLDRKTLAGGEIPAPTPVPGGK